MTPIARVLYAWRVATGALVLAFGLGLCVWLSGCASTGGVAGALVAAKPILDTSCAVARTTCRMIDSACSYYEDATAPLSEEATSGGEGE